MFRKRNHQAIEDTVFALKITLSRIENGKIGKMTINRFFTIRKFRKRVLHCRFSFQI